MSALMTIACVSLLVAAQEPGPGASRIPELKYEKYTLPNGLDVILHEDHATPIVSVNVWYHVGSKNEKPGRTGFAHLFEHMMFQGSKHHDKDYFGPLQKAGGRINGSTSPDRTNYFETVPSNYLELALWMESDRMAFLLPAMTQEKLDNQRSVVQNERRQSYENRPYGLVYETLLASIFPADHPYSWPTIGAMADIGAASREDVASFFRQYYHPGNAGLCIAGDFDPAEAKRLVAKYFGVIPAGPKVEKLKPRHVELTEAKRIRMTDRVGLARLYFEWHTVPMFAEDDAELDILAEILGGGKTSRLYRTLVRDKQIAQEVMAYQGSQEIAGGFSVVATARQGHTLAEVEELIWAEIAKLQKEPPTADEVAQAVTRHESQLIHSLSSISDSGGRADRLNMYNTFTGDPGYLAKDFARYTKVTPEGVQRAAKKYLTQKFAVVEVTPGKETTISPDPRKTAAKERETLAERAAEPNVPAGALPPEDDDRANLPKPAAEPKFTLPPIHRAKLANGLQLLVVENHTLPLVNMNLVFPAGRTSDPTEKLGLAGLVAAVWDEGTAKRTAMQIAEELAMIGADLSIASDWDFTVLRLDSLKRSVPQAVDILTDVLLNPSFPDDELDRQRNIALGRLIQIRNEPTALGGMAMNALLFGQDHPYGRPYASPKSLKTITRDDLKAFYGRMREHPEKATLIAVGDITIAELTAALEKPLAGWTASGTPTQPELPQAPKADKPRVVLIDKPNAPQSAISVGMLGVSRVSPDYFPLVVMNSIYGGQFMSRLNMNLREDKGYTYGARSMFDWRTRQPGPFLAMSSVQTKVTHLALVEFLKELRGITGEKPVQAEELSSSKAYLTRGYPAGFETSGAVAGQLETLIAFGLSDDYFNTVIPGLTAVTSDQVLEVAKKYLDAEHVTVVIVGDRAAIEPKLRELPIGKDLGVYRFDDDFRLVPDTEK